MWGAPRQASIRVALCSCHMWASESPSWEFRLISETQPTGSIQSISSFVIKSKQSMGLHHHRPEICFSEYVITSLSVVGHSAGLTRAMVQTSYQCRTSDPRFWNNHEFVECLVKRQPRASCSYRLSRCMHVPTVWHIHKLAVCNGYAHESINVYTYVYICIYIYICKYISFCIHMHVLMHVCLYVCICMYVCMYE